MESKEESVLAKKIRERKENEKIARKRIFKKIFIISIIIILIDQISKIIFINKDITLIPKILNIHTVQNRGGAFGVGQNSTFSFIVANVVVLGIIIKFINMQANEIDKKTGVALSFVLAGGFSNLIDRLFRGFVVDFIEINFISNFPSFNCADIVIVLGWVLLALFFAIYANNVRTGKSLKEKEDKSGKV